MKYLIAATVSFVMLLTTPVQAQYLDYRVSEPYEVIDANLKEYFSDDGEIMAVKTTGDKVTIQKWDASSLREIHRQEYVDMDRGFESEGVHEFKDTYFLFYSLWDRKNKLEQLFVREIDFDSGTFKGAGRRVIKVEDKVMDATGRGMNSALYFANRRGVVGKFNIQSSFDKSKVLVQYRKKPAKRNDKKNRDVIGLNVFDASMNEISGRELEMPYVEYKMDNIDYTVDNSGNAYVLALIYDGEKRKRFDKAGNITYHLELLKLGPESSQPSFIPIDVEGVSISELLLYNLPDNEVVCAGYYSYGTTESNVAGAIMIKLDEAGKTKDLKTYDIPLEVIKSYSSDRAQHRIDKRSEEKIIELTDINLRGMRIMPDGSVLLSGERYYMTTHTTYNANGGSTTRYHFHYDNILVTKIGPDGELQWMQKLPKRQLGGGGKGGMSFKQFSDESAHYYLFLDNIKNNDLALNDTPAQHSDGLGGYFTAYKVDDATGAVSKEPMFDLRDVRGYGVRQFAVDRVVQVSENEVCVEVYKGDKQDVMIKVFVAQ